MKATFVFSVSVETEVNEKDIERIKNCSHSHLTEGEDFAKLACDLKVNPVQLLGDNFESEIIGVYNPNDLENEVIWEN